MGKFYVHYRVIGMTPSEFKAGPYEQGEIELQRRDIAGYDGVYDVWVESESESKPHETSASNG